MSDNRLVKKKHLQEVTKHLWDEAKKKYVHHISLEAEGVGEAKKNVLKSYKNDQPTVVAHHVVQEWDDLENTSKSKYTNIFNKNTSVIDGRCYETGNTISNNIAWKIAVVPCKKLDTITVVKNANDSVKFALFDNKECTGNALQTFTVDAFNVDGSFVYTVIPNENSLQDNVDYYLAINMKKGNPNKVDESLLMVFNTNTSILHDDIPREYVPYSTHGSKFINGEEVVMSFDSKGGRLESTAIADAIREIDDKMVTEWIDLEHVSETYSFVNLVSHKDVHIVENTGSIDHATGNPTTNSDRYTRLYFPAKRNTRYYLYNRRCDISNIAVGNVLGTSKYSIYNSVDGVTFDSTNRVDQASSRLRENIITGKKVFEILPTDRDDVTHVGLSIDLKAFTDINPLDGLMIWEESQTPQISNDFRYVKDNIVNQVEIDGSKVTIQYPDRLTGIQAQELKAILEELAAKQVQGVAGVESVNGKTGALTLEVDKTSDEKISFKVKDVQLTEIEFGFVNYMTEQQVNEYDAIFV